MAITYGDLPGVTATVTAGSLARVSVGYDQKLVLFGRGDESAGTASYNSPEPIKTSVDATEAFGDGSQLAHGLEKALENGVNNDYLYGVMPTETAVSAEPIAGGSGTLANAPIVEDPSVITVTNTTTAASAGIVFRYESAPDPSSLDADQVAINPLTGEVASGGSDDYEVDYSYLEWDAALDAADTTVRHGEIGVYATLSDSETVAESLSNKLDELRPTYKLIRGVTGAQPNATNANGEPIIDTETYTDTLDNDALFVAGPVRLSGAGEDDDGYGATYGGSYGSSTGPYGWTVLPGIAGKFAGNDITNSIIADDELEQYGSLIQQLTTTEEGDPIEQDGSGGSGLRGKQVIPIRDDALDGSGGLTIEDNLSTSTATDYPRTYHYRRVIDQALLAGKQIGESLRGRILQNRDAVISDTEQTIVDVFRDMAARGLIESNQTNGSGQTGSADDTTEDEEQPYGASITKVDTNTYSVQVQFKPAGVAKNIEETFVITRSSAASVSA